MSWMDSWSRPSKSQATPPPLYLTHGDSVPYCHCCGRVIGQRKTHASQEVKYCSTRCRNNKPGPIDRRIEFVFASLMNGSSPSNLQLHDDSKERESGNAVMVKEKKHKKKGSKSMKGDPRIIVECGTVEKIVFQREQDPEKVYGRKKNRAARGAVERPEDWRSVDMVDDPATARPLGSETAPGLTADEGSVSDSEDNEQGGITLEPIEAAESNETFGYGGGKIRPPQAKSDVNGSVGGEKGWAERIRETDEMKIKRREGQRRADEREMVRRAARRGCAFGFLVDEDSYEKRKCEAVMKSGVVEASFAKGEWGVRWREKS